VFDIHEVTAAPHFPEALKSNLPATSDRLFASLAAENDNDVVARMRDGEIFFAITAS
jgi:hypothetical protein